MLDFGLDHSARAECCNPLINPAIRQAAVVGVAQPAAWRCQDRHGGIKIAICAKLRINQTTCEGTS